MIHANKRLLIHILLITQKIVRMKMRFVRQKRKFPINKKRIIKSEKNGRGIGYVYIFSNPGFHLKPSTLNIVEPIYKIGHTLRSPKIRAWELYEEITGVPDKFKVEYAFKVPPKFAEEIEKLAHKKLKVYRVNKYREFFACHISICLKAIEEAKAELMIKKKKRFKLI